MAWEMREGNGSLFKNDRKEEDHHPDYTGSCLIGGVTYQIAAWIKAGKKGKFMSLSLKPQQPRPTGTRTQAANPRAHGPDQLDEDIPW